jgi:hypothetical protein
MLIITRLLAAAIAAGLSGRPVPSAVEGLVPSAVEGALPDNPCDVISPAHIAEATQLVVLSGRRVPAIAEIVSAQDEGRKPGAGRICVFETGPEFGGITVAITPRAERRAALYWEQRTRYFRTYPGSARLIPGLGEDAWLSGGTSLTVLIGGDEYFSLSTQLYQPESGALLAKVARAILESLKAES